MQSCRTELEGAGIFDESFLAELCPPLCCRASRQFFRVAAGRANRAGTQRRWESFDVNRGRQGRPQWKTVKSAELSLALLPFLASHFSTHFPLSASSFSFPRGTLEYMKTRCQQIGAPPPPTRTPGCNYCSLLPPKSKTNKGARSRFHTFPKKASAETLPLVHPQLNPEEFGASSLKWSFCLPGL